MKTSGIIAEYNPFHNGHKYQLEKVRAQTGADYIIIAMSGNFLQRGIPAIIDKYTRTRMALSCGADLVLELPAVWASSSAEYFATGGVQLLGKTGVVNQICYGCESRNETLIHALAATLCDKAQTVSDMISTFQKEGISYPAARSRAMCALFPEINPSEIMTFLAAPNNILALEYEKAIVRWNTAKDHPLSGYAIQRIGEGYHSCRLEGPYVSATAIRKQLFEFGPAPDSLPQQLAGTIPAAVAALLAHSAGEHLLLDTDDFSAVLYARLWSFADCGYEDFADCNAELSNKIQRNLDHFLSYTQFAELLKSKNLTYARICRVLLHILLGITREDYLRIGTDSCIPYLRVLGFRKDASPLLSTIKKEASVPLVTKVADASKILDTDAQSLFNRDMKAADLYRTTGSLRCKKQLPNEYEQGLVII